MFHSYDAVAAEVQVFKWKTLHPELQVFFVPRQAKNFYVRFSLISLLLGRYIVASASWYAAFLPHFTFLVSAW